MPVFEYRGRRGDQPMTGVIEAASKDEARLMLRRQQIVVEQIKQKGREITIPFVKRGPSLHDLSIFTRQFSVMIDAGLPLVQCLDILSSQNPNPYFKRILSQIKADVESGATFADALKKHPKVFDELFVNLVAAGEIGGVLDTIAEWLSTQRVNRHTQ